MEELLLDYHRTRDRRIRDEIVVRYDWLARVVAKQLNRPGEDIDDLVQVASIGILKALDRFDPDIGNFRAYASATARGEIKRHYRDHAWSVTVPRRLKDLRYTVANATDLLRERLRRSPTPTEVADHLRVPRDEIVACIAAGANFRTLSLTDADGRERTARELSAPDWESGLIGQLDASPSLASLLSRLPARLQTLHLRYTEQLTQAEIGTILGVSQVHVSRLLHRALALLRDEAADRTASSGQVSCERHPTHPEAPWMPSPARDAVRREPDPDLGLASSREQAQALRAASGLNKQSELTIDAS